MQTKSNSFNRCDLFLLGWVVYYLQGILYTEGGILSVALLGLLMFVSIWYFIKTIQQNNLPVYFKGLNTLLLLLTLYGVFHIILNPGTVHYRASGLTMESYEYLKAIWLSLLPIYPFYYFSRMGYLNEKRLKSWFFVFIISCTLTFFRSQRDAILVLGAEEVTNNSGYLMLSLLPGLVLFQRKSIIQFVLLAFILAFIFLGMKRGAILAAIIALPVILWRSFKMASSKQKILFIALALIFVYFGVSFVQDQMQTSDFLMQRIQDTEAGESSGRDSLYGFFIDYFFDHNSFFAFLFGNGANATLDIYKNYAHNDWLEIAINQGALGIAVYLFYFRCFFKTWKMATNEIAISIIALVGIIYFLRTLFSMSYADMTFTVTSVLGYALVNTKAINNH